MFHFPRLQKIGLARTLKMETSGQNSVGMDLINFGIFLTFVPVIKRWSYLKSQFRTDETIFGFAPPYPY